MQEVMTFIMKSYLEEEQNATKNWLIAKWYRSASRLSVQKGMESIKISEVNECENGVECSEAETPRK